MKKLLVVLVALLLLAGGPLFAAGTATWTGPTNVEGRLGVVEYSIAWTSTAGGAVSGNSHSVVPGQVLQVSFTPGTAGTQPSDLYDATLQDSHGIDVLQGAAANLSNATSTAVTNVRYWFDVPTPTLDVVIAAAGSAKTGVVKVVIQRSPTVQ